MTRQAELVAGPGDGGAPEPNVVAALPAGAPGALEGLLSPAPCFEHSLRGYDRVQVDNYVAWAETELTIARRENQELLARLAASAADLEEARRAAAGPDRAGFVGPIAEMLRRAAEEARRLGDVAAEESRRVTASADEQARRLTAEAVQEADRLTDAAIEEADRIVADARLEAEARLRKADAIVEAATAAARERLAQAERELSDVRRQRDEARESLRLLTSRIGAALQGVVLVADDDGEVRAHRPAPVG
jgi:cell division septum initiation protein DivIVA